MYPDSKMSFKGERCAGILLLIIGIFQHLSINSKTGLELITLTLAGGRKRPLDSGSEGNWTSPDGS